MSRETIKASCLVSIAFSDWVDMYWLKLSTQSEKAIETRQGDVIVLFPQMSQNIFNSLEVILIVKQNTIHLFWIDCGNRAITSPCLVSIAFSDWFGNFNQHMQHTYWSEKSIETRQDALIGSLLMWYIKILIHSK